MIDDDTRPVIVGERTNVLGSRKFKELIADGQDRGGAPRSAARRCGAARTILDVCLQDPDRNELDGHDRTSSRCW